MLTVAYLGPEHTNTHAAARKQFGSRAKYVHAPTVDDVFHQVERQKADYGVVPIENSLEGAVTHTLDRFIDFVNSPVQIQGEIEQRIRHYLIIRKGTKLPGIKVVFSHPQALAQCRGWLAKHLPSAQLHETNSTAEAIGLLVQQAKSNPFKLLGQNQIAAIGRLEAARGKKVVAIPIPENRENKTRFLVLGLKSSAKGRRNKTSILFAVSDKPGALHDGLVAFKRNRINMSKIESRPSKQKAWEYLFFVDLEGHESEPRLKRALVALKRSTSLLRILGSYPVR